MDAPKRRRGRPKGYPKSGGRKRGTPNKATVRMREAMRAALENPRSLVATATGEPAIFVKLLVRSFF